MYKMKHSQFDHEANRSCLFITRKFPPETGGMEKFCAQLNRGMREHFCHYGLLALGKPQKHLIWFFPYSIIYTILNAHKYSTVVFGDGLMCFLGVVARIFAPTAKRVVFIHGLDVLYKNRLYQLYLRMFLKKSADLYICNSCATEDTLKRFSITNSTVIPSGIDINAFGDYSITRDMAIRKKLDADEQCLIMITVGRLVKRKGVAWFVKNVMPFLKYENVKYFIIGDGEERDTIRAAIDEAAVESKVQMLGRIPDAELKQIYQAADVFVMPNIRVKNDMEGFGLVAVEAVLSGLTVVASGIEGITDVIKDGVNGYLLESENAEQYLKMIKNIKNNREYYEEKKTEAKAYTTQRFSWETVLEQYLATIDSLVTAD